jgi:hypothetical protein
MACLMKKTLLGCWVQIWPMPDDLCPVDPEGRSYRFMKAFVERGIRNQHVMPN